MVSVEGLVPVRHITKTFASGKTEKMVYQALADVGLPNAKADTIEKDQFTFDKELFSFVCNAVILVPRRCCTPVITKLESKLSIRTDN